MRSPADDMVLVRRDDCNHGSTQSHRFAAALGLLFAAALHGEVKVLKNFTLIDGTGRPPAAASAMIVDNGRITWVGPAAQLKAPAGPRPSISRANS